MPTKKHLQITLESSTRDTVLELAKAERRSIANYIRVLIEREVEAKKGASHEP